MRWIHQTKAWISLIKVATKKLLMKTRSIKDQKESLLSVFALQMIPVKRGTAELR